MRISFDKAATIKDSIRKIIYNMLLLLCNDGVLKVIYNLLLNCIM